MTSVKPNVSDIRPKSFPDLWKKSPQQHQKNLSLWRISRVIKFHILLKIGLSSKAQDKLGKHLWMVSTACQFLCLSSLLIKTCFPHTQLEFPSCGLWPLLGFLLLLCTSNNSLPPSNLNLPPLDIWKLLDPLSISSEQNKPYSFSLVLYSPAILVALSQLSLFADISVPKWAILDSEA